MTLIYLAGPMSLIPKMNFPLFDEVSAMLRDNGYEVMSPADNSRQLIPGYELQPGFETGTSDAPEPSVRDAQRQAIMKEDLRSVIAADAVIMLPGWENSIGCCIERRVAETCGKEIMLCLTGEELGNPNVKWGVVHDPVQIRCNHDPHGGALAAVATSIYVEPDDQEPYPAADRSRFEEEDRDLVSPGADVRGEAEQALSRVFESGANRDDDARKHDYEGYLSIAALRLYGRYMHAHGHDGARASDNWQQGFPVEVLVKSLLRHTFDVWEMKRLGAAVDFDGQPVTWESAVCGVIFNAMALLHEVAIKGEPRPFDGTPPTPGYNRVMPWDTP